MQGFLNLNKPFGFTSHDCIAKVRRLVRLKRVGHGGTLDPMATGVLPIALGRATRLLQYMQQDKAYNATIRLGIRTTTDDLEGEVVVTQSASGVSLEDVKALLPLFVGKIQQIPPVYSAIQVKGQRLYDLARAGVEVEVPVRDVEVYSIDVLAWRPGEFPEVDLAIACGPGTYIRAIARDLGVSLNTGGVLAALTRTQSSGFTLADSLTLEELEIQLQQQTFQAVPPLAALKHLEKVTLTSGDAHRWCMGQRLSWNDSLNNAPNSALRVHDENGDFLGIGQMTDGGNGRILAPQMVFACE
ncbi:MAG: tRNA pseudouridine(55) synthase TruB [Coleofasciculaceae cyanobacterium]